jgi:hypothetical protein
MAVKQIDFDYNEDQRGFITYTEDWVVDSRAEVRTIGTGLAGLGFAGRTAGPYRGHPTKCLVKVKWQGVNGTSNGPENIQWFVEPAFEDLPIETHPGILKIIDLYKGEVNQSTGRVRFPLNLKKSTTGTGVYTANDTPGDGQANPLYGLTSFLTLGCLLTKSYCTVVPPKGILKDLVGMSKTVPGDHGMETPSWGIWVKIAPRWRKKGAAYDIEESWKLIRDGSGQQIVLKLAQIK